MSRIYNEKKRHESAFELAKFLIKRDLSWQFNSTNGGEGVKLTATKKEENIKNRADQGGNAVANEGTTSEGKTPQLSPPPTSLLIATSKGIFEIVQETLSVYPQAVEHVSDKGQNILHVASQNRQLEIFRYVKNMGVPLARLVRRNDEDGHTILHHAGVNYTGASKLAPALQLQEELRWFEVSSSLLNIILVSTVSLILIIEYSPTSNFVKPICQYLISCFKSFLILLLFFC
jgi:hypothetical protein